MIGPLYDFVEEADVARFQAKAIKDYERWLNSDTNRHEIKIDPDFVAYLKVAHGRALRDCWIRDHRGRDRRIDRVFSYASRDDLKGSPQPSWRPGSKDLRLDYSIHYLESMMPNWKGSDVLVPFAGVGANGSAEYDMLCLHLSFIPKPIVVLWEHEGNAYDSDAVHFVARDFVEFTRLAFATRPGEVCE